MAYNVNRWYDANTGRYSQDDPIQRYRSGETRHYDYVIGNPLRFIDPRGLFAIGTNCNCFNWSQPNRPDVPPVALFVLRETGNLCRFGLDSITDINLRDCMKKSCEVGKVECEECEDPALYGSTEGIGGWVGHLLRRGSPTRTATLCTNQAGNVQGEAGYTVIHEWAHGCGYDNDDCTIAGIPCLPGQPPAQP